MFVLSGWTCQADGLFTVESLGQVVDHSFRPGIGARGVSIEISKFREGMPAEGASNKSQYLTVGVTNDAGSAQELSDPPSSHAASSRSRQPARAAGLGSSASGPTAELLPTLQSSLQRTCSAKFNTDT